MEQRLRVIRSHWHETFELRCLLHAPLAGKSLGRQLSHKTAYGHGSAGLK